MKPIHFVLLLFASALCVSQTDAQWVQTNEPKGGYISRLAVTGTNLFAGTFGGGVWKTPWVWKRGLSEMMTSVEPAASEVPLRFLLDQNYPNPFNPSTTIKYELPKSSMVRLSVYDMLGREVSVLVNDRKDAGVHEVKFDGSNLASGVYFHRVQAGDFISTKKMLALK